MCIFKSKPIHLIDKISTHPEKINLKICFNNFSVSERVEFKEKGLQMLINYTTYSQSLYRLFLSKNQFILPEELEVLITDFICPRDYTNQMELLPKRPQTLQLLNKINDVF